jgi:hypothetical protein
MCLSVTVPRALSPRLNCLLNLRGILRPLLIAALLGIMSFQKSLAQSSSHAFIIDLHASIIDLRFSHILHASTIDLLFSHIDLFFNPDILGWVPGNDSIRSHVLRNNTASTDNRALANGNTWSA